MSDPTAQSNATGVGGDMFQDHGPRAAPGLRGMEKLRRGGIWLSVYPSSPYLQLYINSCISTTDLTWRRKANSSFGTKPSPPDLLLAEVCNEVWGVCQYINKELSPICRGIPEELPITRAHGRNGMWVELGTEAAL